MNVSYKLHNIFRVGVVHYKCITHCRIIAFTVTNNIEINKKLNFKKGVGITIKVRKQVAS